MGKDCTDDMITSSANQQMKHLSQLMKRAKERKKEQVFVVEGIKPEAPLHTDLLPEDLLSLYLFV